MAVARVGSWKRHERNVLPPTPEFFVDHFRTRGSVSHATIHIHSEQMNPLSITPVFFFFWPAAVGTPLRRALL